MSVRKVSQFSSVTIHSFLIFDFCVTFVVIFHLREAIRFKVLVILNVVLYINDKKDFHVRYWGYLLHGNGSLQILKMAAKKSS